VLSGQLKGITQSGLLRGNKIIFRAFFCVGGSIHKVGRDTGFSTMHEKKGVNPVDSCSEVL